MSFDDVCAILTHPPWNYRFQEIASLTYYQIEKILNRAVDEDGRVELHSVAKRDTLTDPYAIFVHSMRLRLKDDGTPHTDAEIEELWRSQQEQAAALKEKYAEDMTTAGRGPAVSPVVSPAGGGS